MSAVLQMGRADGVIAVTTANVAELVGEVRRLQGVLVEIIERLEYGQIAEPHAIACAAIGLGDRKTPDHDLFFLEAMAFREALENYACPGIGKCPERVMDDGTCIKETTGGCGNAAAEALADYPHFLAKPEPR